MQIDACKVGWCKIYDGSDVVVGLIVGVVIGGLGILLFQAAGRWLKRK